MKYLYLILFAFISLTSAVSQDLYDFENIGNLHNQELDLILEKIDCNSDENVVLKEINAYLRNKGISQSLNEFYLGNPNDDYTTILNRARISDELKSKCLEILDYIRYSMNLKTNNEYQVYINNQIGFASTLNNSESIKFKRFLALLSHSIYYWLPSSHGGLNKVKCYSRQSGKQAMKSSLTVRDWLTVFADVFSHDCVGAVCGGWSPPTAAAGFAGGSALRGLSLAWDN